MSIHTLARELDALARRLTLLDDAVHRLAAALNIDLGWLDVLASNEVVHDYPASWDAMLAAGRDPESGDPLSGVS